MATSKRSLGRTTARREATVKLSLSKLQELCIAHHRALGHSEATIYHYQDSFRLMDLYLAEAGLEPTTDVLIGQTFQGLSAYLRRTPTKGFRGGNERSAHGIHGVMKDWRAFVRWAHEEEYITTLPKVPVPKLPQNLFPILSEDDLASIFQTKQLSTSTEIGKRNRALISLMLDTGIRLAEAAGLSPSDIDLQRGMAKVRGKGNKERMVFFSEGVTKNLKAWLAIRGDDGDSLFWLTRDGVRMLLKRIQKETGLPILTAHQFRHTAASMLVKQHADLHTVKRILGHSQLSTVEIYLTLDDDDLKAKHTASSPFEKIREAVEPGAKTRRRLKAS